jgi:hypothetical protein
MNVADRLYERFKTLANKNGLQRAKSSQTCLLKAHANGERSGTFRLISFWLNSYLYLF